MVSSEKSFNVFNNFLIDWVLRIRIGDVVSLDSPRLILQTLTFISLILTANLIRKVSWLKV